MKATFTALAKKIISGRWAILGLVGLVLKSTTTKAQSILKAKKTTWVAMAIVFLRFGTLYLCNTSAQAMAR